MAPWGDGFLYAAVVVRVDDDDPSQVLVAYWEGESATVAIDELLPCELVEGAKVFVNHLNVNDYQAGKITRRLGGAIQVELKNGSMVWTTWAKCRIKQPKPGN